MEFEVGAPYLGVLFKRDLDFGLILDTPSSTTTILLLQIISFVKEEVDGLIPIQKYTRQTQT
jgi:hypothetical protein